jgi:L-methionine (R)-S-oxide reductase
MSDRTETEQELAAAIRMTAGGPGGLTAALGRLIEHFAADSGTIHLLGDDGILHLKAASAGIPDAVLALVRTVPIGKGMAGLAVERGQPVNSCNIQTDRTGDVRPGAKATGLQGSIVVPILRDDVAIGAVGIANLRERTFSDDEAALLMRLATALA